MKEKKIVKKIYTTPKLFAECIDTVFSNNVEQIAEHFGVKAVRRKGTCVNIANEEQI